MSSKTFAVPNISCGHCVMTIKNELSELAGVSKVDASQQTRMVTVEWHDPATWEQIKALLTEINYPPAPETH
jgi:copper chaperone